MDYRRDYVTVKRVKNNIALFNVNWSGKYKVDRYGITGSVPSRPGIFELYYKTGEKNLKLFYMERVWYGGLRAEIRRASDPGEVPDRLRRRVLLEKDCYFRYTIVESKLDMRDLLYRYSILLLPDRVPPANSGRYRKIIIDEK